MRAVIQRVSRATVTIDQVITANIGHGLLVLLGVAPDDELEDIKWLCKKIAQMRIFGDEKGVMNKSVVDVDGEIIVVSQFTLHASTKKGNRPSYIRAAKPDIAIPLYEQFVQQLHTVAQCPIQTGRFGADMKVSLLNDGPVTIIIDSRQRE